MGDTKLRDLYEFFKHMALLLTHAPSRTFVGFITVIVWTWIVNIYLMSSVPPKRIMHMEYDSTMTFTQMNDTYDESDTESQNWIPATDSNAEACRNIDAAVRSNGAATAEEADLWKKLNCLHRIELFYHQWCVPRRSC